MSALRNFAKGMWVDKHLAQWITMILIMINVGVSIAVIVGGTARFSIPSYSPLIAYVNGETWIWGASLGFATLLMSVPFRLPNILGLWLSMIWYIIWMACFTIAVTQFPTAAATPIPIYGGLAMISAALMTARVIDKSGG